MSVIQGPALWQRDSVLVAGQWRAAALTTDVENPATTLSVGTAAQADLRDVDDAVSAARTALRGWAAAGHTSRSDALWRLHAALLRSRDDLVAATVAEVGAPLTVAREAHVDLSLEILAGYAALAATRADREVIGSSLVLHRPAGVVAAITPWNYPLYQLVAKVAAALAAGCTVVAKPAELTPLTAYLFGDAVVASDLPPGVVNLVPGSGPVVGAALAGHRGVDVVSFTGSTAVGRQIGAAAGQSLKRASLELGGKSAAVVLDGADLAAAVRATVDSAMFNSGQTCSALTRLVVPSAQRALAAQLAAERAHELVVGDPRDERTHLGPVISGPHREQVLARVQAALGRGARLVTEVQADHSLGPGYYVRPTVLVDVEPRDDIAQQEVFGPVLVVLSHEGEDDAVRIANGTAYGLSGAVWAADDDQALRVAGRLDTGQVDVNGAAFNPLAPFGGWKDSGLGRELGPYGIQEFVELTAVQLPPADLASTAPRRPITTDQQRRTS
jgi:acyl-CoA reductase-like NAD-dependent aldehyde dehydrogenase